MNYKIIAIEPENSIVVVSFDVDGVEQRISGAPLESLEQLNQFLFEYGTAYESGLAKVSNLEVDPAITESLGKRMSLEKVEVNGDLVLKSTAIKLNPVDIQIKGGK